VRKEGNFHFIAELNQFVSHPLIDVEEMFTRMGFADAYAQTIDGI
jgi:hypothetical protein